MRIRSKAQLNSGDPREAKLQHLYWLRNLCRGVMVFGFVASGAGNILHAKKEPVGIVLALAAPVILSLAFELISRIPLRKEANWMTRTGRLAPTLLIAGIAAYNSFFHQRDALLAYNPADIAQAWTLPIAVDLLMIVGSVSLIELGIQIMNMEAFIEGRKVQMVKPAPPMAQRALSKKEIITKAWRDEPHLTIKQLAEKVGASYNYTHSMVKELSKDTEPATV
jgi:hypothetical protein